MEILVTYSGKSERFRPCTYISRHPLSIDPVSWSRKVGAGWRFAFHASNPQRSNCSATPATAAVAATPAAVIQFASIFKPQKPNAATNRACCATSEPQAEDAA